MTHVLRGSGKYLIAPPGKVLKLNEKKIPCDRKQDAETHEAGAWGRDLEGAMCR